jgi:hypothetical protein
MVPICWALNVIMIIVAVVVHGTAVRVARCRTAVARLIPQLKKHAKGAPIIGTPFVVLIASTEGCISKGK